jgi:cytoskeletal protein CcmA (bactofilin family)
MIRAENKSIAPQLNMISEKTVLTGNLSSDLDIRVAGEMNGDISSKGKVIVANSAKIKGNISASEVDLAGVFKGNIKATTRVILRSNARVDGDIQTKSIVIEEGSIFNGALKMGALETVPLKGKEVNSEQVARSGA